MLRDSKGQALRSSCGAPSWLVLNSTSCSVPASFTTWVSGQGGVVPGRVFVRSFPSIHLQLTCLCSCPSFAPLFSSREMLSI